MRLDDERESDNVQDLRGDGGGGIGGGFGGGGGLGMLLGLLPMLGMRGGGAVAILIVLALVFGPRLLSGGGSETSSSSGFQRPAASSAAPGQESDDIRFVRKVTASTEDVWTQIFQSQGREYRPPIVTLYSDAHRTGCGEGQSAMGPFYCPLDHRVWLDLNFFQELSSRFGAPGRFAQAYVVAHEVGHHVQTLLGTMDKVERRKQLAGPNGANPISVRTELQADCYAGVWAHGAQADNRLDPGDVEQGLRAAAAVGDDTLQKETQGRVEPDSFTHGTSEQRVRWFQRGFQSGQMSACDTFSPAYDAL